MSVELSCEEVRRELVNYFENGLPFGLRKDIDSHLRNCRLCTAVYDGVRNVLSLVAAGRVLELELPPGCGQSLYTKLLALRSLR